MHGYTHDSASYLRRLRRIEGQIRGLERMVEEDKYCIDILTQVSAATKALQAVPLGLLEEHLSHCVSQALAKAAMARPRRSRKRRTRSPVSSGPDSPRISPEISSDSGPRQRADSEGHLMTTTTYKVTGM